jgi:hypothetical protein
MGRKEDILAKTLLESMNKQFQKNSIEDGFTIGKVISIDPLTIDVEGLPLYEKDLNINKYLLAWDETVNITTSTVNDHSHTINIIHHLSKFNINDSVAMYGIEYDDDGKSYQRYCVLAILN